MFLKHQISILEWLNSEDHVAMKTKGIAAENSALPWQE